MICWIRPIVIDLTEHQSEVSNKAYKIRVKPIKENHMSASNLLSHTN